MGKYRVSSSTRVDIYILLDVLVYNIAVYFYEFCSILTSLRMPRRDSVFSILHFRFLHFQFLHFRFLYFQFLHF